MLSARSPKYPALYDIESGVRFRQGKARVTEAQAQQLAERWFVDGILIGEFDDEGRIVNELPAKDWRKKQRAADQKKPEDPKPDGADEAHVPEPRRQ